MLFLVITLPVAVSAQNVVFRENIRGQSEAIASEIERRVTTAPTFDDIIGEDIIINIDQYEPTTVRSGLLEEQGLVVYALLSGIPTNPTVRIPMIRDVAIVRADVTTIPPGLPARVGAIRHVNTPLQDLSYENMGYLMIPINRIPLEDSVPDEIVIDLQARVLFDVSSGLGNVPTRLVLTEQPYNDWLTRRDDNQYNTVYLHATEITSTEAAFTVYDQNLNPLVENLRLKKGETSRTLRKSQLYVPGQVFNQFTINLRDIKSQGNTVKILVNKDDGQFSTTLSAGESLYPGSTIYLDKEPYERGDEIWMDFRGPKGKKTLKFKKEVLQTFPSTKTIFETPVLPVGIEVQKSGENYTILKHGSIRARLLKGATELIDVVYAGGGPSPAHLSAKEKSAVYKYIKEVFAKSTKTSTGDSICSVDVDAKDLVEEFRVSIRDGNPRDDWADYENFVNKIEKCVDAASSLEEVIQKSLINILVHLQQKYDVYLVQLVQFTEQKKDEEKARAILSENETIINPIGPVAPKDDPDTVRGMYKKVKSLRDRLVNEGEGPSAVGTASINPENIRTSKEAHAEAIREYQRIIESAPGQTFNFENEMQNTQIGEFIATIKAGKLYLWSLNEKFKASDAFNDALELYRSYSGDRQDQALAHLGQNGLTLANLNNFADQNFVRLIETLVIEEENGEQISITPIDTSLLSVIGDQGSRAYIKVNNREIGGRFVGEVIIDEEYRWEITSVEKDYITLTGSAPDTTSAGTRRSLGTKRIEIGKTIDLQTGRAQGQINKVKLDSVDLHLAAHVTVSPHVERAFSNARTTIHIPIEKRAFDVPLFTDSIDEEIAKTEELLQSLSSVIDTVEQIHNTWKQLCFIVFGFIWSKNLITGIFGGGDSRARAKASESFKEQYADPTTEIGKDCAQRRLSYDECVFEHQEKYEQLFDSAEEAYEIHDEVTTHEHLPELSKSEEDEKAIKNLALHESLANAGDEQSEKTYYEELVRLKEQDIRRSIDIDEEALADPKKRAEVDLEVSTKLDDFVKDFRSDLPPEKQKRFDDIHTQYNRRKSIARGDIPSERVIPASQETIARYIKHLNQTGLLGGKTETQLLAELKGSYVYPKGSSVGTHVFFPPTAKGADGKVSIGKVTGTDGKEYQVVKGSFGASAEHEPVLLAYNDGRHEGKIHRISVDPYLYGEVEYTSAGRVKQIWLFERDEANAPISGQENGYASLESAIKQARASGETSRLASLQKLNSCISKLNRKKITGRPGEKLNEFCDTLGQYTIRQDPREISASCTDIYSPADCKLLFNACDPVICPESRCDLGGAWKVNNVVETGIIGSTVLCLPNFGNPTIVPICITGIYAGLKNIESILRSYNECLKIRKVEGASVGVCDKIRSFYICQMLWREAIAIFNVENGVLGWLGGVFYDEGGGEYADFEASIDQSVEGLEFFTQQYARDTFAQFSGGSLPEIGAEVCKSAIYGKVPGVGSFVDRISRPESPPQFTATLDSAPYSDIPDRPLAQYQIFYHMYAGANEDITYSVYLRGRGLTGESVLPTLPIIQNRRLPRDEFASENIDRVLLQGYNEICINYRSPSYGVREECGFGKASTSFALNYVLDEFVTQQDALRQIQTAEDCVPSGNRLTSPQAGFGENVLRFGVGGFSNGLLQSGIVRQCSKNNPGLGGSEEKWAPVGQCFEDGPNEGRNLGTCWLFKPTAQQLIQNLNAKESFSSDINQVVQQVVDEAKEQGFEIPGFLDEKTANERVAKADALILNKRAGVGRFPEAVKLYKETLQTPFFDPGRILEIRSKLAEAYWLWGLELLQNERAEAAKALGSTSSGTTSGGSGAGPTITTPADPSPKPTPSKSPEDLAREINNILGWPDFGNDRAEDLVVTTEIISLLTKRGSSSAEIDEAYWNVFDTSMEDDVAFSNLPDIGKESILRILREDLVFEGVLPVGEIRGQFDFSRSIEKLEFSIFDWDVNAGTFGITVDKPPIEERGQLLFAQDLRIREGNYEDIRTFQTNNDITFLDPIRIYTEPRNNGNDVYVAIREVGYGHEGPKSKLLLKQSIYTQEGQVKRSEINTNMDIEVAAPIAGGLFEEVPVNLRFKDNTGNVLLNRPLMLVEGTPQTVEYNGLDNRVRILLITLDYTSSTDTGIVGEAPRRMVGITIEEIAGESSAPSVQSTFTTSSKISDVRKGDFVVFSDHPQYSSGYVVSVSSEPWIKKNAAVGGTQDLILFNYTIYNLLPQAAQHKEISLRGITMYTEKDAFELPFGTRIKHKEFNPTDTLDAFIKDRVSPVPEIKMVARD